MKNKRIVFLGTPEFAVPSLKMLVDGGYNVVGVITQPDREKGRGHRLIPPPVKSYAAEKGIPVFQYAKLSKEGVDDLKRLSPDLLITAAYGQILSQEILDIPKEGCINVHGSLLPKYRGAAPIEWCIIDGETKTGITTMYTVYELDAGDILVQDEIGILPEETGGELRDRMAEAGAETLRKTLEGLENGTVKGTPQNASEATICHMFKKDFGCIDFTNSVAGIVNLVRGLNPQPMAYVLKDDEKIKVLKAREYSKDVLYAPGKVVCADDRRGLLVQANDGIVEITSLQYPGGKPMESAAFMRGKGKNIIWDEF